MKTAPSILTLLALLGLGGVAGCGAGNASAAKPARDRSAISVRIRAEPKQGWRDGRRQLTAYEIGQVGAGHAFETIDYAGLNDIVVWAKSEASQTGAPGQVMLDLARVGPKLHVSGTDDVWRLHNSGGEPLLVYARQEAGGVSDIGTIAPGGSVTYRPRDTGLVEILSDGRLDPLARVYVAPIPSSQDGRRARVARSGAKVVFSDLAPGPARVGCWHPRLPGSTAEMMLAPGATTAVTLRVSVNELPPVP